MDSQPPAPLKKNIVYGRRIGRPLGIDRAKTLAEQLPRFAISEAALHNPCALNLSSLFKNPDQPLWMEIGFGNGEHLEALLRQNPHVNFIGAEPFINGMSALLKSIEDLKDGNLRLHMNDALQVIAALPDVCMERLYILNPDPWPKKRHNKRRIVRPETLDEYARALKPGGLLVMATDVDDLAEWMVTHTINHGAFEWTAEGKQDWQTPPAWWPLQTRYAEKGEKAGRRQSYLVFRRI